MVGAVAQQVQQVVDHSEGWQDDPRLLWSTCRGVLGQDTEPQIAPDGCTIGVKVCVCVPDEQIGSLQSSLQSLVCEWVNADLCNKVRS